MEHTYEVVVAFEGLPVGHVFSTEETIRLRILTTAGYLKRVDADEEPVVAPRRRRRAKEADDGTVSVE